MEPVCRNDITIGFHNCKASNKNESCQFKFLISKFKLFSHIAIGMYLLTDQAERTFYISVGCFECIGIYG